MLNKVTLIGSTGRITKTDKIIKLSVVTVRFNKLKEMVSSWHTVTIFGDALRNYLNDKFDDNTTYKVYVEGSLNYGEYTNREGVKVNSVEIIADTVKILSSKPKQQKEATTQNGTIQQVSTQIEDIDDIPF